MAITALPSADGQELTIQIQGRFDFGAHQDFRDAYERSRSLRDAMSSTCATPPTWTARPSACSCCCATTPAARTRR